MPANTFNIDSYGIGRYLTLSAQSCWGAAGTTRVYIGPTDYTASCGDAGKFVLLNGVWYRCTGQGTEAQGVGVANVWNGSAWVNGPGTNYYFNTAVNKASAFTGGFYYGDFLTLGTVKNTTQEVDSPHDVMGMPGQTSTGTLAFDVEGVVTTISVDGCFYETTATTMNTNLGVLEGLLTGNQYINNPCVFWWDVRLNDGQPKPMYVSVKKFTFQRTEKDVSKVDYKLQLVVRALSV